MWEIKQARSLLSVQSRLCLAPTWIKGTQPASAANQLYSPKNHSNSDSQCVKWKCWTKWEIAGLSAESVCHYREAGCWGRGCSFPPGLCFQANYREDNVQLPWPPCHDLSGVAAQAVCSRCGEGLGRGQEQQRAEATYELHVSPRWSNGRPRERLQM